MTFWIVAALMTAACTAIVLAAFRTAPESAAPDVAVYRDQLAELDRDRARGTLGAAEAEAARAEVGRRLLAADRAAQTGTTGRRGSAAAGMGLAAGIVVATAFGTYLVIGARGYGDMPLAARLEAIEASRAARTDQLAAEAAAPDLPSMGDPEVVALAEQLRTVLAERPDDLRGWQLAAQTEAGLGDFEAAWRAQDRVVTLRGSEAAAEDFSRLAELMILAADGYVSPEAERALRATLMRDPADGIARYYLGSMYAQGGRPDRAWPIWRRLVADSTPDAPWLPVIYERIEAVAEAAGDPTTLDQLPRPRGPSQADVDLAADMTLEERQDMIAGMIQGLAARLADQGGPPEDWGRLIVAYGVSGDVQAAATVYQEAKLVFASDQAALDGLAMAADRAGLAP